MESTSQAAQQPQEEFPMPFYITESVGAVPIALDPDTHSPIEGQAWFFGDTIYVGIRHPDSANRTVLDYPLEWVQTLDGEIRPGLNLSAEARVGVHPVPHYLLADETYYAMAYDDVTGEPLEGFVRKPDNPTEIVPVGKCVGGIGSGQVLDMHGMLVHGVPVADNKAWSTDFLHRPIEDSQIFSPRSIPADRIPAQMLDQCSDDFSTTCGGAGGGETKSQDLQPASSMNVLLSPEKKSQPQRSKMAGERTSPPRVPPLKLPPNKPCTPRDSFPAPSSPSLTAATTPQSTCANSPTTTMSPRRIPDIYPVQESETMWYHAMPNPPPVMASPSIMPVIHSPPTLPRTISPSAASIPDIPVSSANYREPIASGVPSLYQHSYQPAAPLPAELYQRSYQSTTTAQAESYQPTTASPATLYQRSYLPTAEQYQRSYLSTTAAPPELCRRSLQPTIRAPEVYQSPHQPTSGARTQLYQHYYLPTTAAPAVRSPRPEPANQFQRSYKTTAGAYQSYLPTNVARVQVRSHQNTTVPQTPSSATYTGVRHQSPLPVQQRAMSPGTHLRMATQDMQSQMPQVSTYGSTTYWTNGTGPSVAPRSYHERVVSVSGIVPTSSYAAAAPNPMVQTVSQTISNYPSLQEYHRHKHQHRHQRSTAGATREIGTAQVLRNTLPPAPVVGPILPSSLARCNSGPTIPQSVAPQMFGLHPGVPIRVAVPRKVSFNSPPASTFSFESPMKISGQNLRPSEGARPR